MRLKLVGFLSAMAMVAGFGIWQGSAAASSAGHSVTAPIQQGNGDCGANDSTLPVIGQVQFMRRGHTLTLLVTLTGATANDTYDVLLFSNKPVFCSLLGDLGTVTTDANGDGSATFRATVEGKQNSFFADPEDGFSGANDTPAVTVR